MNKKHIVWLIMGICLFSSTLCAEALVNQLDSSQKLPLKWKAKVGLTTYRTTLQYSRGKVFVPSNGKSRASIKDDADGVYIINGKTGKVEDQLVLGKRGDRDVNGVAISASKIVFGTDENMIGAFDWEGKLLWVFKGGGDIEGAPALGHFSPDTVLDVVVATEAGELIVIDGATGTHLWAFKPPTKIDTFYPSTQSFMGSPGVIDINKDGYDDIVIGNRNGVFYAFEGQNGALLWKHNATEPSGILSSPLIQRSSIWIAESYGYVHRLSLRGRKKERLDLILGNEPQIVAMPYINEERTVVVGTTFDETSRGYWHMTPDGAEGFTQAGDISASTVYANVDEDPEQEFVLLTEGGEIIVLGEDGEKKAVYSVLYGGEATPLIADVDEDNKLELVIALDDGMLYCYDLPSTGPVTWGRFRANPYNTGVEDDTLSEDTPIKGSDFRPVKAINTDLAGYQYQNWASLSIDPYLISEKGVGHAYVGMTMGQFRKKVDKPIKLKSVQLESGVMATAVIAEGEAQYYLIFPQHLPLNNQSRIMMVMTNNPSYQTIDGVQSGMKIKDVTKRWGRAIFSYDSHYPLEERTRFKTQPPWMVISSYSKVKAGVYTTEKKLNSTRQYQPGVKMQFIGVR